MVASNKAKKRSSGNMSTQALLDLDLEESSSDSDFRIEDHDDGSDDFSDENSNDDDDDDDDDDDQSDDQDDDEDSDEDESDQDLTNCKPKSQNEGLTNELSSTVQATSDKQKLQQTKAKEALDKAHSKLLATPICCACLGDRSDDSNEIVECDNCGISVHEGCYGISDSNSVSSTVSSCSTEPWFCEACKANAVDPTCELCPNKGGIFKETDVGKWVHLICALYVPGVAFGEVDQLSSVTLFEMPYSKWGAKSCSLCEDVRYARTGVCIGCDAGMCKTYFHVTCAQAAGLLSEAHSEEADHADPFYAHCKIHSDKTLIKHRKRNYNGLKIKMEHRKSEREQKKSGDPSEAQKRIERKLKKHRNKYVSTRAIKTEPWVPTQKMPRLLTTSASVCRKLSLKAKLMGINAAASEFQEAQMAALADVRKKWHIPPAFSVEFIGYYLDRISRIKEIKNSLQVQLELNKKLVDEQQKLRDEYDQKAKLHAEHSEKNAALKDSIKKLHQTIQALCPNKSLPTIENIGRAPVTPPVVTAPPVRPMVPTAAALKMGVGFPLTNLPGTNDDTNRILSTQCQSNSKLMHECGICKRCNDQHLLAKCDTCHLHYHLGCLNPPLTRHPKKSKLYGWQCSECVKSDDSDGAIKLPTGPRKSRTKYSKDGTIVPVDPPPPPAPLSLLQPPVINSEQDFETKSTSELVKTIKVITKKPENKRTASQPTTPTVEKMEEVLMPSVSDTLKNSKLKKLKNPNQVNDAGGETVPNIATESPDPLDISNNELIILPLTKDSKRSSPSRRNVIGDDVLTDDSMKSNKKTKRDNAVTTPQLPCYVDTNGIIEPPLNKPGHFVSELIPGIQSTEQDELTHKQNRKRRKEKHRNSERSQSKEHKKKRKKEKHDLESVQSSSTSEGIPRIKIKFKALPLPGETAAEPQFFYVSADMVRPAEICRSPSVSVSETKTTEIKSPVSPPARSRDHLMTSIATTSSLAASKTVPAFTSTPIRTRRLSVLLSPKQFAKEALKVNVTNPSSQNSNSTSTSGMVKCDVCNTFGTMQNIVKCDECKKNYHFHCLEPPLKKSPKKRGYSWHCADCDPTDVESN